MQPPILLILAGFHLAAFTSNATLLLSDSFSYPDSELAGASAGRWAVHSPSPPKHDLMLTNGAVRLAGSGQDDVNALLPGAPYSAASIPVALYASFSLRVTSLPSSSGAYFAHFKESGATFRAKIFVSTAGAAAGSYRIGLANSGNVPAMLAADLSPGDVHTLVCRLMLGTGTGTLWLDPANEKSPCLAATDTPSGTPQVTSFALRQASGEGVLLIDDLRVGTCFLDVVPGSLGQNPPFILAPPRDTTVIAGSNVTLSVRAGGDEPLRYQWRCNGTTLASATDPSLVFDPVRSDQAGRYDVVVANGSGSVTSSVAVLTVVTLPATDLAHLRTLQDAAQVLTDKTNYFLVRGVVTTHANLATGTSALFYIQDATAGMAVLWTGGASRLPPAGAKVEVNAKLSQSQGQTRLVPSVSDHASRVTLLSSNNPLPVPVPVPFDPVQNTNPAFMEPLEGSYVIASNVFLGLESQSFVAASGGELITNDIGQTFTMAIADGTDIPGALKPDGPVTILGVLGQSKSSPPYDAGYRLIPTRYADFLSPALPPVIHLTNYLSHLARPGDQPTNFFPELVLRPGESLRIAGRAYDAHGLAIHIEPQASGLPSGAGWNLQPASPSNVVLAFDYTPAPADAGSSYLISLRAWTARGTNDQAWSVYVPTRVEQRICISEFLANPTADTNSPGFNPLRRPLPWTNANLAVLDEFVEIANLSDTAVDLYNWSVSDSARVRHRFYAGAFGDPPEVLNAGGAIVIYGGPLNSDTPLLPVAAFPASEGASGLALNNSGAEMIILRNQDGQIVDRVCYLGSDLSARGSLSRFPDLSGDFVAQADVGPGGASPGAQYDGSPFSQPPPILATVRGVTLTLNSNRTAATLRWPAGPGTAYTVWSADTAVGSYRLLGGGAATNALGQFIDPDPPAGYRFYYITTP